MKNLYFNSIVKNLKCLVVLLVILFGVSNSANAQVKKAFTQRTSPLYVPERKIYNVKGDFTMLGNTCLTPQNYTVNGNNNDASMIYVDTDGDSSTFNSSSSTLVIPVENGSTPECSNIVFAGLYWTGKSSANQTFNVTKPVPVSSTPLDNNLTVVHNQAIANTSYTLTVTRGGSNNNRYPIYTFTGGGSTYAFSFLNSGTNRVTLSINGGSSSNIPSTVNGANTQAIITGNYTINDGTATINIKNLIRDAAISNSVDFTVASSADINVGGALTVYSNVTKTFNKRIVKLKGPTAGAYTDITAAATDIYYPSGSEDDIYTAYAEITSYVRANGVTGKYTVADMALLEGNPGGTGYSGGWGIIVIYENSKMKWRDVTIFDGYAYVESGNSSAGIELPVSGFNTVQSGNVGMKIGVMASEGDVNFTGDYFKIRNLNTATYTTLSHSGNSTTNFFNSSINSGGARIPNLVNNTGIDIATITIPNTNNTIIGNGQTSTKFLYGTDGDTYSIFTIAMSVDAYVPEVEATLAATSINMIPVVSPPYVTQPGQDIDFNVDIKNIGTEAVNNFKVTIPMPYNATYVAGSAVGTILFAPLPTPNSITFNPSLGATGSIVWDFGTLPLPANPNTILAKLKFKLRATTDCSILVNTSCGNALQAIGFSSGIGAITNIALVNKPFIEGYTQVGNCIGEPIPQPLDITIDGLNYVQQNCANTPVIRAFSYCSANTTVSPTEIASFFPAGSLFYNQFPVTINAIQYTTANPIPLVSGSTVTYYAVPPNASSGCNFQFTISKCPSIVAQNDALTGGNGTTGNPNAGNVLNNNGSGPDTLNGVQATISQVNITVTTPAVSIGGAPVPVLDTATGQVSVPPGTPAGTYTIIYNLCEKLNPVTNCDPATVTITVTKPVIIAQDDTLSGGNGTTGNPNAGNVLNNNGNGNDTLNGANAVISLVNITVTTPAVSIGGGPVPVLATATGQVSVPAGTPAGTYTIIYNLCEKLNPTTNCDPATVTITVTASSILAVENTFSIQCSTAGALGNVITNDLLNGVSFSASLVNITLISGGNANISLNLTTGDISTTGAGLSVGQYTLVYRICEKLNPANCSQANIVINVVDTVAPTWTTAAAALNTTVECSNASGLAAAQALFPVAIDACDNNVTNIVKTSGVLVAGSCGATGTYTNTWTVTDDSGNTSVVYTQTITIVDTVAPTWTTAANALNTSVECSDAAALAAAQALAPIASDNCAGSVTYTKTSGAFVAGSCGATGTYTNTWVAKDACLNTSTPFTQTISVVDTVAPTWSTAAAALNTSVECSDAAALAAAQALAPTATDNCAGAVTYTKTSGAFVAGSCGATGTYTNTWVAKDACLNTSTQFTQTITVVDTVAPTWTTAAAALNTSVECSDAAALAAAQALAPTATDNCAGAVTYTKTSGAFVAGSCGATGTYTNTWVAKDACLNTSTQFTQTISVVDTVAPTWTTAAAALNTSVECSDAAALAAAQTLAPTATDNCAGAVTYTKTSGAFVAGTCGATGTYTNTWVAKDACLNTSTTFTQTISVVDTVAPTWTTAANALDTSVECSDAAALAAAQALAPTATDNCAGAVTYTKTSGAFVAGSCGATGTYTNTWVAKDACLNTSTQFTQTITVVDTVAPTWTTAANALDTSVECSDAAALAAAQALAPTATDNCAGAVTYTKTSGAFVAGSCGATGTYTNTWVAKDACLNTSTPFTQTISVVDTVAPTWTTVAAALNTSVECSDAAALAAAQTLAPTATDNCAGAVTYTKTSGAFVAGSCGATGTYTNTWVANDSCLNTSTTFTQIITVVDTTNPQITTAAANATVQCDGQGNTTALQAWLSSNGGAISSDTCSDVTWSNNFTALSNGCGNTGAASVTFTATDACGNTATTSAIFTIEDTTAPTIDTAAANATVQCDGNGNTQALQAWLASNGGAAASDICSNVTWSNNYTALSNGCGNTGSATVTFTATDDCGNTITTAATFTIEDTTAPTIDTAATNATVQCDGQGNTAALQAWLSSNGGAVASDICSGTVVTWTNNFTALSDGCGNTGSATVIFTATDDCGNTVTTSAIFTIEDTTAPTIDTAATNLTVQCNGAGNTGALQAWLASNGGAAASDTCSGVTWSNDFASLSNDCSVAVTVTFTATDACGNASTTSATFTVEDTVAPTIDTAATNATVQCDGQGNTAALQAWLTSNGGAAASDTCTNVTWSNNFTALSDGCGNSGAATVIFTATDACGNTATTSAIFTIEDTTAPTIDTAATNVTVQCDGNGNSTDLQAWLSSNGGAVASDICSGTVVTWTNNFTALSDDCGSTGTASVIFTATDDCGNTVTTSASFTIEDTTAPTIGTAAANATAQCDGQGNTAALQAWLTSNGGAVASDICSGTVTWSNNFTALSDGCGNTGAATVIFTATDACGNNSVTSATFTIEDTTAPTIDTAATNITVQCNGAGNTGALQAWLASNGGAAASDVCSGVTWSNDFASLSSDCSVAVTVTFTATDDCGNASTTSATFTVEDTVAPTINTAAVNATVQCDGEGNTAALQAWLTSNGGAAASDTCTNVTWSNNFTALSNGCGNTGTATVIFTATDACGNTATTSAIFTIEDTTAPTIDTAASNATAQCDGNGNATDLQAWLTSNGGAVASDICSNVTWSNNFDGLSNGCGNTGSATVTFTATDDCGNTVTTSATFTVEDTTAPTIGTAAANATVQCDGQGNAAALQAWLSSNGGAVASDICSGTLVTWTNNFTALSDGCGNTGSATVIFTATDDCGNTATTSATFTIEDTTAPAIGTPAANLTVQCNGAGNTGALQAWLDSNGGAVATDACSSTVTWSNNFSSLSSDCSVAVTVIFTATDDCGNASTTSATFTVEDTVAPTINTAAVNVTVQCDGNGNTAALQAWLTSNGGAAASDTCTNVTWSNNFDGLSNGCGNTGAASVIFTATDACGNTATSTATFTIEDTTAPTLNTPAANATAQCDGNGNTNALQAWLTSNGGATASDICSNVTWSNNFDGLSDGCGNTGNVTVIFTATDDCGNFVTTSATFAIEDTTAPTIDTAAANATVQCDGAGNAAALQAWLTSNGGAASSDACSTVTWSNDFTGLSDGCGNTGSATVIFTATDDCGNTVTTSATFTIQDNTAPVIDIPAPASTTVACIGDVPAMISLSATDNCAGSITVLGTDSTVAGSCVNSFTVTRTWTFTDACNNTSTAIQTITVNDNVAPTFNSAAPANTTASCDNIPAPALITATDNCGTAPVIMTETILQGACASTYQIVRTWTTTDACGNSAFPALTQTIDVSDTTGPTLVGTLPTNIQVICTAVPAVPTLVFTDNCSVVGTPVFTETQSASVGGIYTIIRTWTVSDACGNLSPTYTQEITVTEQNNVTTIARASCPTEDFAYDLSDLSGSSDVPTDAVWTNENGIGGFNGTSFNALGIAEGSYLFTYTIASSLANPCPRRFEITITVDRLECAVLPCESIEIHNAFTPNGDGINEYFSIENLEDTLCYPTNKVEIYNRWGVLVYEVKNYDNGTRKFEGVSEGRATVSKSAELPTGTYFYIIQWTTSDGQTVNKDGYLYLTR